MGGKHSKVKETVQNELQSEKTEKELVETLIEEQKKINSEIIEIKAVLAEVAEIKSKKVQIKN